MPSPGLEKQWDSTEVSPGANADIFTSPITVEGVGGAIRVTVFSNTAGTVNVTGMSSFAAPLVTIPAGGGCRTAVFGVPPGASFNFQHSAGGAVRVVAGKVTEGAL